MVYTLNSRTYTVQNTNTTIKDENKWPDDYVSKTIGAFGLWQFVNISIASSTRIIAAWNTMSVVFIAPETEFVCRSFSDNTTVAIENNTCYDSCIEYEYTNVIFEETMTSEFDLICKNEWLRSFLQTILMTGMLCGVGLLGWFSDRFGRSKGIVLSGITCTISMYATSFSSNFWIIAASRFLSGLGTGGYYAITAVYVSELVGTRLIQVVICSATLVFDGAGMPIQAAFGYFTSTWRSFMIVCSSATVILVCISFFLSETPRWLVAKGKTTEAIVLITKAAKLNKLDTSNIGETITQVIDEINLRDSEDINLTYLDLFRTKKLAIWTTAMASVWFVTGLSYFGLLQYISQFSSNLYIVYAILGVVQIVTIPLTLAVVKFCGRKVLSICIYAAIGVISLAFMFTPKGSLAGVVAGCLGVSAATMSFIILYIMVIELYPTPMRNMGLSSASLGSKIAAMVAPFVVNLRTGWIASSIFAAAGFSAVLICFLLPETKGKKLKDTIKDIE